MDYSTVDSRILTTSERSVHTMYSTPCCANYVVYRTRKPSCNRSTPKLRQDIARDIMFVKVSKDENVDNFISHCSKHCWHQISCIFCVVADVSKEVPVDDSKESTKHKLMNHL